MQVPITEHIAGPDHQQKSDTACDVAMALESLRVHYCEIILLLHVVGFLIQEITG